MARTRQIKPGFFLHTELSELEPICRLLFIGLWTVADREGRLKLNPKRLTAELLPYESGGTTVLLRCLRRLALSDFLNLYGDDSSDYIEIVNFKKHQHIHRDEKASELPAIDKCQTIDDQEFVSKYQLSTEEAPHNNGSSTEEAPKKNALKLIALRLDPLANSLPTSSTANAVEVEPLVENQNRDKPAPVEMRATLAPMLGWGGEKAKDVNQWSYTTAVLDWLCAIYPDLERDQESKTMAGKIVKLLAVRAFNQPDKYQKSWPPVAAFLEFLKLAIGEPKDGGGLLDNRKCPTRKEMYQFVGQVLTNGMETFEYAHEARVKAGIA